MHGNSSRPDTHTSRAIAKMAGAEQIDRLAGLADRSSRPPGEYGAYGRGAFWIFSASLRAPSASDR